MAVLEPKSQEIPFTFGIDLSQDDEGTASGAEELENYDFDRDGAAVRRFGFVKSTNPDVTLGLNVPEMLLPSGANGLTALDASQQCLDVSTLTTLYDGRRVQQVDSAVDPSRSWICVVATVVQETSATSTYECVYWVVSLSTGVVRDYGSLGSNTWGAQLAAVYNPSGGTSPGWNIYYASGASTPFALKVVKLTLSTGVSILGTPSTVAASMWDSGDSMLPFSVRPTPTPGSTYVAYVTVTTGQLVVVKHDYTATQTATLSPAGATVTSAATSNVWLLVLAAGTVCMFYQNSTNIIVKTMDAALAGVTATATLVSGGATALTGVAGFTAAEYAPNQIVFFSGKTTLSGTTYDLYVNTYDFGGATLGGSPFGVQHALPLSRADAFVSTGGAQNQVALLTGSQDANYPNGTVLAWNASVAGLRVTGTTAFDELAATSPSTRSVGLTSWSGSSTTKYIAQAVALESPPGNPGAIRRVRVTKASFGPDRAPRVRAKIGNQGFVAGGYLRAADGQSVFPAAFTNAPAAAALTGHTTGGSNLLAGTYSYRVVLELTDATGTIQVSPPSSASSVTLASSGNVDAAITSYVLAGTRVRAKLYRNTLATPSTFNLVATYVLDANTTGGGVTSITHNDNLADANVGETLYTTGGALASELAPALSFVCAHRDRLFGVDALDPHTVRFTTEISDATAPRWNAALTFRIDNSGGPALALASMNDKLLVFQRDQICVVTGEGPDGLGSGAFSVAERVANVGVEPSQIASVVETPVGVFFAHRTGIQLIGPDLQVVQVGRALGGKTVGTDIPVSFGRYVPTRQQVWFQTQQSGSSPAPIYIFDLRFSRWMKWTGSGSWTAMLDVLDLNGVVYVIPNVTTGSGSYTLMELSTSDYRDENPASLGSFVAFSQVVATPWFRGDREQEMRLWAVHLTGRKYYLSSGTSDFVLQVYTQDERKLKDSTAPDNTYTWLSADQGSLPINWSLKARCVTQRCRAFRCRLTITPASTTQFTQYDTISAITYDFGVLPGRGKVPAKGRPAAA